MEMTEVNLYGTHRMRKYFAFVSAKTLSIKVFLNNTPLKAFYNKRITYNYI